jgi:hypothetical protein
MSQDHIELLFGCIRGKNGFNNNPDFVQFKSSLRRLLVKNSIQASKNGNCVEFEADSNTSIFDLKAKKAAAPPVEALGDDIDGPFDNTSLASILQKISEMHLSEFQEAIIGYIAGFIIRKIRKTISYATCFEALTEDCSVMDHAFGAANVNPSLRLIAKKQRGGLFVPSGPVIALIRDSEKAFRLLVSGEKNDKIPNDKLLKLKVFQTVTRYSKEVSFERLSGHDLENCNPGEDLHSVQLKKKICELYLEVRLITYGKKFSTEIMQKPSNLGKRQQLNKLVLFQSL